MSGGSGDSKLSSFLSGLFNLLKIVIPALLIFALISRCADDEARQDEKVRQEAWEEAFEEGRKAGYAQGYKDVVESVLDNAYDVFGNEFFEKWEADFGRSFYETYMDDVWRWY